MASGIQVETRPTVAMTEEFIVVGQGGGEPQIEVATEVPGVAGEEFIVDANTFVGEEVVVDESGAGAPINEIGAKGDTEQYGVYLGDNGVIVGGQQIAIEGGGTVVQDGKDAVYIQEDEIQLHHRTGTDEMSVAIDLAKLSQGHYTNGIDHHSRQNISIVGPNGISNTNSNEIHLEAGAGTEYFYDSANNGQQVEIGTSPNVVATPTADGASYVFITEDGREAKSLEDLDGQTVQIADKYTKPKMSYAQLTGEAIMHSKERQLTLSELYAEINKRHPYYSLNNKNWQNSIRHNLTLNKSFTKVPRNTTEGRGSYWTMEPGAESVIFKRQARASSGGSPSVAQFNRTSTTPNHQTNNFTNSNSQVTYVTTGSSPSPSGSSNSSYSRPQVVVRNVSTPSQTQTQQAVQIITQGENGGNYRQQHGEIIQEASIVGSSGNIVYVTLPASN